MYDVLGGEDTMKINKAIREVMKQKGISLSSMGDSLWKVPRKKKEKKEKGSTNLVHLTGNDVSARLNNDNLSFSMAVEMLNVLGYEIVIQEKKQGGRRADQIVIDQQTDTPKVELDSPLSTDEEPETQKKKPRPRISLPK